MLKKQYEWPLRIALLSVCSLVAIGAKKRLMLVNLQKLGDDVVANPPWYYQKVNCTDMYSIIEWSDNFCIAMDIRIALLLPIAIFCIGIGWFLHVDKKLQSKQ